MIVLVVCLLILVLRGGPKAKTARPCFERVECGLWVGVLGVEEGREEEELGWWKASVAVRISRRREGGVSRVICSSALASERGRFGGNRLGAMGVCGGGMICLIGVMGGSKVPLSCAGEGG